MALPLRDQRHRYLRREIHQVWVFDFEGLPNLMAEGLSARMLMEHRDAQGWSIFTSRAWRRQFDIRGPLVHELILEFFSTFREFILAWGLHSTEEMRTANSSLYLTESARRISNKGDMRDYWIGISSAKDFLGTVPSYTFIRDPMLRGMDVGSVNVLYLLARYLRLFALGRKQGAMISRGCSYGLSLMTLGYRLEEEVHGMREALLGQRAVLDRIARDFSSFSTWTVISLARMIDRAGVPYTRYLESPVEYERCTRCSTNSANTSTTPQQPDP
nr:hypothetical protein [Tanacetum cinerariifolium]